jgi:hypothetical protein
MPAFGLLIFSTGRASPFENNHTREDGLAWPVTPPNVASRSVEEVSSGAGEALSTTISSAIFGGSQDIRPRGTGILPAFGVPDTRSTPRQPGLVQTRSGKYHTPPARNAVYRHEEHLDQFGDPGGRKFHLRAAASQMPVYVHGRGCVRPRARMAIRFLQTENGTQPPVPVAGRPVNSFKGRRRQPVSPGHSACLFSWD